MTEINNPYLLLDTILSQLKELTEKSPRRIEEIYTREQMQNISNRNRTIIFAKLKKDGFIDSKIVPPISENDADIDWEGWYITFEGIIFLDYGGYVQQQIDFHKEKNNLRVIQETSARMEKQTYVLTVILAVSSVVAAGYYIHELWKYCC